jgi:hypothetical protein
MSVRKNWVSYEYKAIRIRARLSVESSKRKALWLRSLYIAEFSDRMITAHSIDNPYMTSDARAVIISQLRRDLRRLKS